jgi:hypothetical protein
MIAIVSLVVCTNGVVIILMSDSRNDASGIEGVLATRKHKAKRDTDAAVASETEINLSEPHTSQHTDKNRAKESKSNSIRP